MENYDVIIVGSGIAGTGLAYNLKKGGYKGSVLLIDKDGIGKNQGHAYRNTFAETLKYFNLPYCRKFKGVKIGVYDKVLFTIDTEFYAINYTQTCKKLFKRSDTFFRKETALGISKNVLITEKNNYKFKYLIDCSGSSFFLRKLYRKSLSFRYWLGKVRILKNNLKLNDDYFIYLFSNDTYCEEIYFLKQKIIQGDWQYTNKVDFNLIKPHKKTFYNNYKEDLDKIKECNAIIPGVRPILESSEILAKAIIKDNLLLYEKEWKKRYFDLYYKHLVSRLDGNSTSRIVNAFFKYPKKTEVFNTLKNYPSVALKRLRNEEFKFPPEVRKKFPLASLLARQFIYRVYAQIKIRTGS